MPKLSDHFKSDINIISIKYGDEMISFNLVEELKIDTATIRKQVMSQATHYGFLTMLAAKVSRKRDDAEIELDRVKGRIFSEFKSAGTMARPVTNEVALAQALAHIEVVTARKNFTKLKEQALLLFNACRSFEHRGDMLKILSRSE